MTLPSSSAPYLSLAPSFLSPLTFYPFSSLFIVALYVPVQRYTRASVPSPSHNSLLLSSPLQATCPLGPSHTPRPLLSLNIAPCLLPSPPESSFFLPYSLPYLSLSYTTYNLVPLFPISLRGCCVFPIFITIPIPLQAHLSSSPSYLQRHIFSTISLFPSPASLSSPVLPSQLISPSPFHLQSRISSPSDPSTSSSYPQRLFLPQSSRTSSPASLSPAASPA